MRKFAAALLCVSAFLVTGCFDIEQSITLERNLSGQGAFSMKVDMEPLVGFMALMKNEMSGKKGAPTAAELAEIRKELMSSGTSSAPTDFEKEKKEIASKLPKGVSLLDANFKADGLKMTGQATFAFDHASKLAQISLPNKGGGPGGPNPAETPFENFQIIDEGKTILVTVPVENPASDAPGPGGAADAEMAKQMEALFKGLRIAVKITAPFEVVEHNAHRKTGNTLTWEYDLATMQKLTPEQAKQGIKVRYRK